MTATHTPVPMALPITPDVHVPVAQPVPSAPPLPDTLEYDACEVDDVDETDDERELYAHELRQLARRRALMTSSLVLDGLCVTANAIVLATPHLVCFVPLLGGGVGVRFGRPRLVQVYHLSSLVLALLMLAYLIAFAADANNHSMFRSDIWHRVPQPEQRRVAYLFLSLSALFRVCIAVCASRFYDSVHVLPVHMLRGDTARCC